MDCLNRFKVLLSEPQYLPHLLLVGGNSGPGDQITVMVLPGGNLGPGDSGPKAQIAAMVLTGGDWGPGDLGPGPELWSPDCQGTDRRFAKIGCPM